MKRILIILVCLLIVAAVATPVFAGGSYVAKNASHTQPLGGKSTHAGNGLQKAVEHGANGVAIGKVVKD
jgi:uncharacterized ion transporter superfamily protein YfcC